MIGNININTLEGMETQVIRENKRDTQLGKQLKADQNLIERWSDDQRGKKNMVGKTVLEEYYVKKNILGTTNSATLSIRVALWQWNEN